MVLISGHEDQECASQVLVTRQQILIS
jgi:hypothetical protein